ncbi:hypothetical protein DBB42_26255 [Pseudomonas plecoglossicida]|uniref:Uncharacterized protein n=1 Tax=Pseudomonas plecoglossicida TaxID=70775 RepID=A0A2R7UC55_PSEDL|nr:hypothetical protein [Pseudomonas plecoglossicida]PTU49270.1 hypothetical protein DBB42_26255 [Pseudomonas plecoglossicida]
MPTENRSSNTDPRDVFIRLNPLGLSEEDLRKDSTGFEDPRIHSDYLLFLAGYRETHPEPQPHPEPIAWMVGTAFWWTKEEAERDAAATGLPIVGLGQMTDAGEAARLRIELGHMRDERDDLSAKLDRFYSRTHGIKNLAAIEELSEKLADRDALLTDISKRHWSGVDFDLPADLVDRIKALSASAEPNAPGVLPRAHDVNMFQRTAEPGAKS